MKIERIDNPQAHFRANNYEESQVLSARLIGDQTVLEIAVLYAYYNELASWFEAHGTYKGYQSGRGNNLSMRRLLFQGVRDLAWTDIRYPNGWQGFDRTQLGLEPGFPIRVFLEAIKIIARSPRFDLSLAMGSYGRYSFHFDTLTVVERILNIRGYRDSTYYWDEESQTQVEYYRPFDDIPGEDCLPPRGS